jgi:hypothetical protein
LDIAQSRPKIAARQMIASQRKTHSMRAKNCRKNLHKNAAIASHTCHLAGLAFA